MSETPYVAPVVRAHPTQSCTLCGRWVAVDLFARGFPPAAAERKLRKLCKAHGCECAPSYRAGVR